MFNFYKLGNHFRNQKVQRRKKRKKVVFMENPGGLWTHLFDIAMCPLYIVKLDALASQIPGPNNPRETHSIMSSSKSQDPLGFSEQLLCRIPEHFQ